MLTFKNLKLQTKMHKETKKFHNQDLGLKGELIAQSFLRQKGIIILETNYRHSRAELDIIAMDGAVLVFVEVKTRSSNFFGEPEEFVSLKKEELMFQAAMAYMEKIQHDWEIRFDIISIIDQKTSHQIKHIQDVFF